MFQGFKRGIALPPCADILSGVPDKHINPQVSACPFTFSNYSFFNQHNDKHQTLHTATMTSTADLYLEQVDEHLAAMLPKVKEILAGKTILTFIKTTRR